MAKTSKSKKKSSRSNKQAETAQSPPAPPKQLNPFYIEPPAQASTWEGDYDWNNNEKEEEQAGLLMTPERWNNYNDDEEDPYAHPRYLRYTTTHGSSGSEWKFRACILFSVVALILWVLLSTVSGDHPSSSIEQPGQTQEAPVPSSNDDAPQLIPPPSKDKDDDAHKEPIEGDDAEDAYDVISNESTGDREDDIDESSVATSGSDSDEPAVDDDGTSTNSANETKAVVRIVVLGERHSGVEWLLDILKSCYVDGFTVTSGLTRDAYWFQDALVTDDDASNTTFMVLAMVRDPYDWLQDMWLHPEYAPAHYNNSNGEPLPLRDFLSKEWSTIEETSWTEQQSNTNTSSYYCQLGFAPTQVVPCLQISDDSIVRHNSTIPIYELDPATGQAFENIMALRAAKLKHWFDTIPVQWDLLDGGGVVKVNYEKGLTDSVRDQLNARIDSAVTCSSDTSMLPPPSAPVQDAVLAKSLTSRKYLTWMLDNVDWQLEARVGYSPRPAGSRRILRAP